MSNSITRSPSAALIHDSLAAYSAGAPATPRACEDRLEAYLAADPQHALERGRRLFDLVRAVPKPDDSRSSAVPALPGDLPDLQTYLSAARPLVKQITDSVDAKSPLFHLAGAALRPSDIDALISSLCNAIVTPVLSALSPDAMDADGLVAALTGALSDSFLAQDATFRYAMHLSPETLRAIGEGQAETFRRGLSHMQAAMQAKMPEVVAQLMEPESIDLTPLSAEDQAKCDRMEAWFAEVKPDLLAKLDTPMPSSEECPQVNGYLKREMLLMMDDALADFDLDALAAFHRSAAGKEIQAKEALLAPDQEGGLLHLLVTQACEPYVSAARAEQEARAERFKQQMEQMMLRMLQQLGLDVSQASDAE